MNKSVKIAVLRSSLTGLTRRPCGFTFLVFCRHQVAKYPQCNSGRGVETGENGRRENSNALPGNSGEPATTSPHDISQIKCDTPSPRLQRAVVGSTRRHLGPQNQNASRPSAAGSHPRRRSVAFSRILNAARLRHRQLLTCLRVNYPILSVKS